MEPLTRPTSASRSAAATATKTDTETETGAPGQLLLASHLYDCLYGDLDEATQNLDLEDLARQVQEGRSQVAALKGALEEAQREHRDQVEIQRRTIQHLEGQAQLAVQSHASLLLTARAELNRKNDRIRELTDTLDRFMLKKCEKVGLLDQMRALLHEYHARLMPERDCITLAVPDSVQCVSHHARPKRPPVPPEARAPSDAATAPAAPPYQTEVKLQRSGQYNVLSMGAHSIAWHIEGCRPAKPPKTLRLKSRPTSTQPASQAGGGSEGTADVQSSVRQATSLKAGSAAEPARQSAVCANSVGPGNGGPPAKTQPRSSDRVNPPGVPQPTALARPIPLEKSLNPPPASEEHRLSNHAQPTSGPTPKGKSEGKHAGGKEGIQPVSASPLPAIPEENSQSSVSSHSISDQPRASKKARLDGLQDITSSQTPISWEKLGSSRDQGSTSQESKSSQPEVKTEKVRSARLSSSQRSNSGSASSSSRSSSVLGRDNKDGDHDINDGSKATRPPVHVKSEAQPPGPESRPTPKDRSTAGPEPKVKKDDKVPFAENLEDGEISSSEEESRKRSNDKEKSDAPRSQTGVGPSRRERTCKPITSSSVSLSSSSSFAQSSSCSRSERYPETLEKSSLSRKRAHSPRSHSSSSCSSSKRSSRRSGMSPKRLRHDHRSSSRTSRESSSSRTKHKSSSSEGSAEGREHKGHPMTKSSTTIERPRPSVVTTSSKAIVPKGERGERTRTVDEDSRVEQPQQHIRSSTTMTKTTDRITSQVGTESLSKTLTKVVDREIRPENKSVSSPKGGKAPRQLAEELVSQKQPIQNTSVLPPKPSSGVSPRSSQSNVLTPKATNTQDPSKMKKGKKEKEEQERGKEQGNGQAPTETGLKLKLPLTTLGSFTSSSTSTKSSSNEVKKPSTEKSQLSQYLFGESDTESQDTSQNTSPRKGLLEGSRRTWGEDKSEKSERIQDRDGVDVTDMNTVDIDSLIEEKTSQFQSLAKKADHIYQRILTSDAEDCHDRKKESPQEQKDSPQDVLGEASLNISTENPCSSPPSENDACYNPVSSPSRLRDSVPLPTYGSNRKRRITQEKIDFTSPVGIASLLKEVTEGAHLGMGNVIMTPKSGRSRSSSISSNTGVPQSGTTPKSSRSSPAHARNPGGGGGGRSTPLQGCVLFPEGRDGPADPTPLSNPVAPPPLSMERTSIEKKESDPAQIMDDNANMGHEDVLDQKKGNLHTETVHQPPRTVPEEMVSVLKNDLDLSDASHDMTNGSSPTTTTTTTKSTLITTVATTAATRVDAVVDPPPTNASTSKDSVVNTLINTQALPSHSTETGSSPTESSTEDARERRRKKKQAKQEKAEKKKLKKAAKKEQKRLRKIEKKVNKRLKKEKSRNRFVIKSKADQICIYSHD